MLAWLPFPVWPFNLLITHVLVMQLHLWISGSLHAYLGECMNFSAIEIFSPALNHSSGVGGGFRSATKKIDMMLQLPAACLPWSRRQKSHISLSLSVFLAAFVSLCFYLCLSVCLSTRPPVCLVCPADDALLTSQGISSLPVTLHKANVYALDRCFVESL